MDDFVCSFVFGGLLCAFSVGASGFTSADNSLNVDVHVCRNSRCEAIQRSIARCRENNQDYCDVDLLINHEPDNSATNTKPKD